MSFLVAELKNRYKLGKQSEINRRKHLGIVPKKVEGVYVIEDDELSQLDALDQFLNSAPNAKMSDFSLDSIGSDGSNGHSRSTESYGHSEPSKSRGRSGSTEPREYSKVSGYTEHTGHTEHTVLDATVIKDAESTELAIQEERQDDLVLLVETIAEAITPPNPISHWEKLQWLVDNQITITTSEVQALVGVKPTGDRFERGSFVFTKYGKIGIQSEWGVSKK